MSEKPGPHRGGGPPLLGSQGTGSSSRGERSDSSAPAAAGMYGEREGPHSEDAPPSYGYVTRADLPHSQPPPMYDSAAPAAAPPMAPQGYYGQAAGPPPPYAPSGASPHAYPQQPQHGGAAGAAPGPAYYQPQQPQQQYQQQQRQQQQPYYQHQQPPPQSQYQHQGGNPPPFAPGAGQVPRATVVPRGAGAGAARPGPRPRQAREARDHGIERKEHKGFKAGLAKFFYGGLSHAGLTNSDPPPEPEAGAECDYMSSGPNFHPMRVYSCKTCRMGKNIGVCEVCAYRCHYARGHKLVNHVAEEAYCDCGSQPSMWGCESLRKM